MALFQKSVLNNHKQNESLIATRWANYQKYHQKIEAIREFKEEEFQDGFLKDIFEECLGYTLKTTNPSAFNLEREKKNETDSKKADGAILHENKVIGVIELKDQKSQNLDKIELQAFGYNSSHQDSRIVIISNFNELRLYIDKRNEYERWYLFSLDYESFKALHLVLSYESISNGTPIKLKEQSVAHEQTISKELYKDYSRFRTNLYNNIITNNTDIDKAQLLRLTQKLCDRIVFVLFGEDRGLLTPNTIREIRSEFKNQKFTSFKLYNIYKFYFDAIDNGNTKMGITKYNGGLFAKDELLDSLIIDDEFLDMEAQKLSDYDFASDVSVNILGHIFEQSLTDLEELQASIEQSEFDKKKSKRKKDGVFYTPEYITRYIVDNTVGKLCHDKRAQLGVTEIAKPKTKPAIAKLIDQLDSYREWLLNIKILDPACGSGAFLNQALEYLIAEHTQIQREFSILGDITHTYDIETSVLENNLYGVDINEDAAEIARLSLWLRTAKKGRTLTKLSDKIVSANSLLAMPFEEGSFDVVIGNPPYVRQEMIDNNIKEKYMQMYPHVATSTADLYVYFYELSIRCLSEQGLLGFITPNKWMERKYGMNLRRYLKDFNIQTIINYGELNIFEDASTEPAIVIIKNQKILSDIAYLMVKSLEEAQAFDYKTSLYKKSNLSDEIWKFTNPLVSSILNKFKSGKTTLREYTNGGVYYGIKTGLNEAFIIDKTKYSEIVTQDTASEKLLKKMVEGDDFGKWHLNHSGRYMVATGYDIEIENEYKGIYNHLENYYEKLVKRQDKGKNYWNLRACDYYDKLEHPKLIYNHTALNHNFYYDTEGYYISANCYFIGNADKYLQCVLNSKLFGFVKKYLFPAFGDSEKGGRVRLDANKMNTLPIKEIKDSKKEIYNQKADLMLTLNKTLHEKSQKFLNRLSSNLGIEKLSKKLQAFYELEFTDFMKELNKSKITLTLKEQDEWEEYFNDYKKELVEIKNQIDTTDKEIDKMVYELYGLSEDEIMIVEGV